MIISNKHRFIFLKTQKTAGTSLEMALSQHCGPEDIITPISKKDEKIRKENPGRAAQNFQIPFSKYQTRDYLNLLKGIRKSFYNHMPHKEVKENMDSETWNQYYKFCFERNPFDKMISFYYWEVRNGEMSFLEFLKSGAIDTILWKDIYSLDGKLQVDKVYKFENLEMAVEDIAEKTGIKNLALLPFKAKGNTRKDKRPYKEIINKEAREIIENKFSWELETFNYKF